MAKKATKNSLRIAPPDRFPPIAIELVKRPKTELIAMIMEMAHAHDVVARELEDRLNVEKPVELLVADVSAAIDRATQFDKHMMNYNFDVDWVAYAEVQNGLVRLVDKGCLEDAKLLALKLMNDGSYQVECSDEGLMSDEICRCLKPVIAAIKATGGADAARWAKQMIKADRVGFLCDEELSQLLSER